MDNLKLIDQFLDHYWLSSGASKNTLSAYRSDLKLFSKWLNNSLTSVSDAIISDYFKHRQLSSSTQARILTCLRIFYQYLIT
ncbi:MAG TPA: site-specific tyrosine recombinase XerD, partial [Piscirickettsiaceae bacterium]|nr:site-specific tyrosine recombinase XerD [Piscirickettsiaceae bacterium]